MRANTAYATRKAAVIAAAEATYRVTGYPGARFASLIHRGDIAEALRMDGSSFNPAGFSFHLTVGGEVAANVTDCGAAVLSGRHTIVIRAIRDGSGVFVYFPDVRVYFEDEDDGSPAAEELAKTIAADVRP